MLNYDPDVGHGDGYRDRIARYISANFGSYGIVVYTEIEFGRTIIGKNRRLDVFALRPSDQRALALECKYQASSGTADEKIPYAIRDLEALWIPGVLAYAGGGWSRGVLHMLQGSRSAVFCDPTPELLRDQQTIELDHIIAAVFGLWDRVLPASRRLVADVQLDLPLAPFAKVPAVGTSVRKKTTAGSR